MRGTRCLTLQKRKYSSSNQHTVARAQLPPQALFVKLELLLQLLVALCRCTRQTLDGLRTRAGKGEWGAQTCVESKQEHNFIPCCSAAFSWRSAASSVSTSARDAASAVSDASTASTSCRSSSTSACCAATAVESVGGKSEDGDVRRS